MRKLRRTSAVDTSQPASSMPPIPPELFWIGTQDSHTCWPCPIKAPEQTSDTAALEEFLSVLSEAKIRVWILDPHFDGEGGYAVVRPALDLAYETRKQLDVRILTRRLGELEAWMKKNRLHHAHVQRRQWWAGLHDRYALIDYELWHFGSTVGGGYPHLSSASRGWFNHAEAFSWLFENWWAKVQ